MSLDSFYEECIILQFTFALAFRSFTHFYYNWLMISDNSTQTFLAGFYPGNISVYLVPFSPDRDGIRFQQEGLYNYLSSIDNSILRMRRNSSVLAKTNSHWPKRACFSQVRACFGENELVSAKTSSNQSNTSLFRRIQACFGQYKLALAETSSYQSNTSSFSPIRACFSQCELSSAVTSLYCL